MRPLSALFSCFALTLLLTLPSAHAHVAECRDVSAESAADETPAQAAPAAAPAASRAVHTAKPAASVPEGPKARSLAGALLRSSPVMSGIGETQPLPDSTTVRLVSPLKNTQGNWWFVTASGIGGGWVRDVELTDYQR